MDTKTLHDSPSATNTGTAGALTGLHHVTAITAAAADNVRFYTRTLGMRLTKKTVNQDDVNAYHLFYGDAVASPGSELTFFDWDHAALRRRGAGTVASTGLRAASEQALEWWAGRLTSAGVAHGEITEENGRATLHFLDPEGQSLVLVDDRGLAHGTTWRADDIVSEHGVKGLGPVTSTRNFTSPSAPMRHGVDLDVGASTTSPFALLPTPRRPRGGSVSPTPDST